MRVLVRPDIDHRTLYNDCVLQTQNVDDRTILQGLSKRIGLAGDHFVAAAEAQAIHTIQPLDLPASETELVEPMYDSRLVSKTGRGRWAYNQIKNSAHFCPYCSFGEVYELDHFLSRSGYPELNICPSNLVPICHPCNHIKLDRPHAAADGYLLHPYFDVLPDVRWLFADLTFPADGPLLWFRVELDEAEYGDLALRLFFHFNSLQLDRRFQERAAQVLIEIEDDLVEHLGRLGQRGLADHFMGESNMHFRLYGNSLEAAAYLTASQSAEFCAGRYHN